MRFWWAQKEGRLYDEKGWMANGYSGAGRGRNNPALEDVPDVGPVPRGTYMIGPAQNHPKLGPVARALSPQEGTDTHGRDGFYIHGDSLSNPGHASHGCVIVPLWVREEMRAGDTLTVVEGRTELPTFEPDPLQAVA